MEFRLTIRGTLPLIMHNARLANPLDPAAKELKRATAKRNKTDQDHETVARIEHAGSLYWDEVAGPYLPADNVTRALWDAAKKSKRGPKVQQGLLITTDVNPLAYEGPRDVAGLWADERFRFIRTIVVARQRVPRCRPIFHGWATQIDGILDPAVLDFAELQEIAHTAGMLVGLGDWRPRFGRFDAEVEKL